MKFRSPGDPMVLTKELAEMRDELTPKQIAFAEHLVAQENRKTATECAILAGYKENSARITASKLQSPKEFPKVHAYIRALQEDLWNKYKISPATHMRRLHEIGLRAENPTTNDVSDFEMKPDLKTALAAEISRGKAAGYYEKKEKQSGRGIDSLSLEEVDNMLKQMRKEVIIEHKDMSVEPKTVQGNDKPKQSDKQIS
jgi:phage terminase small subunit|tara:strand:- start:1112 stop:1708 length:597 start_codon:yes stop_codon:yes gene_type:complete